MQTAELAAVPGVAECSLPDDVLASLPASAPPAPWVDCAFSSVIWYGRGGRAAAEAAGPAVAAGGRALAVVGGMVAYRSTPVGAYNEVFGTVGFKHGRGGRGTIPFMAVDLRESLVGGRQNWSLPKCLASFEGSPADEMVARGPGWTVRVAVRPFGPSFPIPMKGKVAQAWPDGQVRESLLTGRGRGRSALVTVSVSSTGSLASWLRPGRHLGVVVPDGTFTLSEAR